MSPRKLLARVCFFSAVIAVLLWAVDADGAIRINEFLASNDTGLLDEDGDASDWIEVYNTGPSSVSLSGWSLTDNAGSTMKWTFPNITINNGEFLVVFASGKDRKPSNGDELHTNFKLDKDGEYLALCNGGVPESSSEWSPQFPAQHTDFSYGNKVGETEFWYYDPPTPGASNTTSTRYEGLAEQPVFSHNDGTFTSPFSLILVSPTAGGTIRYTLDGSEPTASDAVYGSPISITNITTVRARVYKSDYFPSDVRGRYYLRLAPDIQNFDSNMPIVVIDSDGVNIDDQGGSRPFVTVSCAFIDTDEMSGRAAITDVVDFGGRAGMHIRGASSAGFAKKQYRFETRNEEDDDKAVSLLGMPEESDWILHAPYSDKTLMRNYMVYWDLWSARMGNTGLRTRFFELFYNADGDSQVSQEDYRGVYILIENIKRDKNRVDIAKLEPSDNSEPDVSGGYIFKKDWHDSPGFSTVVYNDFLMYVDPEDPELTTAQKNWIKAYCDEFEVALAGPDFANPVTGYRKYIDVPSMIDNQIMVEISRNVDGYVLSTYYYKDRGGKITAGPLWDYNGSLGGADYFESFLTDGWHFEYPGFPYEDNPESWRWYERMMEDPEYLLELADRWFDLREDKFTTANLMQSIDDNVAYLTDNGAPDNAVDRNFYTPSDPGDTGRWNIDNKLWPNYYDNSHNNTTYMDYVNWMKTWITGRVVWLDDNIASQFAGGKPPIFKIDGVRMDAGGPVDPGDSLTIELPSGASGTIYYTLDGEDPHQPSSPPEVVDSITLVAEDAAKNVLVPTGSNPSNYDDWRTDPNFNDSGWNDYAFISDKTGGVGYEKNSGYQDYISYDVDTAMYNVNTTCYIRIPFTASTSALSGFNSMTLRVRYDDGFIVYLNGTEIADYYAPGTPTWNSTVIDDPFRENPDFDDYDVSGFLSGVVNGDNVLAIHGLNLNTTSSDFLMSAELIAEEVSGGTGGGIAPTAMEYTGAVTITETTLVRARILDGSDWSALNSATYSVGEIGDNLSITEMMYHPADGGAEYIELQNIGATPIDLTGVQFTEGIEFTFPPNTVLAPGEYIVLVRDSDVSTFVSLYPGVTIGGIYSLALSNAGEDVQVVDPHGAVLVYVEYNDAAPWPTSADGLGFSLVIIDPAAEPNDSDNWRASTDVGGSPGDSEVPPGGYPEIWIDFAFNGTELGTQANPYDTLDEGLTHIALGGTLKIKSDSAVTATDWTGRITDPMRIESSPAGSVWIGDLAAGSSKMALSDLFSDETDSSAASDSAENEALARALAGNEAAGKDGLKELLETLQEALVPAGTEESTATDSRTTFEPVLPFTQAGESMQAAQADSVLAIRLRSEAEIDPDSIWGPLPDYTEDEASVEWQPVEEGNLRDVWVIFRPQEYWYLDEVISVTVGATTLSGEPVEPVTYEFQTESESEYNIRTGGPAEPIWQPQFDEDFDGEGLDLDVESNEMAVVTRVENGHSPVSPAEGGVVWAQSPYSAPYVIGPERVYDVPQRVWLPVPENVDPDTVQMYYYHATGVDAGWYPAENVEGWLVPDSYLDLEVDDTTYLGFLVRHAGIVQLGVPRERIE